MTTYDKEKESALVTPIQMNFHNLKEFDELCDNN